MPFVDLNTLATKEPVPGYKAVFLHSDHMTVAFWNVAEGAVMPEHSHPSEQVATIVEGRFELTIACETRILEPGTAAIIPSGIPHAGKALTRCRLVDAFYPVRKDYQ